MCGWLVGSYRSPVYAQRMTTLIPGRTSTRERVAAEVRAQQARLQMSQTELASHVGLSQQAISRRLRGELPFDLDELERVADALGVPVDFFFRASENFPPDEPGGSTVRHQGLEPRTRWLRAVRDESQAPGTPFLPSEKGYESPWPNVAKVIQPLIPANANYTTNDVVEAGYLSDRVGA